MNRMLINATQNEELRVALVNGQQLYDLDIERAGREQKKANIYKGKITRLEPSLEAAFVDYGATRHGFLPLKEIANSYFINQPNDNEKINIKDVVHEGQEVIIQVDKEERGNKGAALTTFVSLAGCYLVLMPNNPSAGGISRRIEGDERDELRATINQLVIPEDMGLIVRTAGVGRSSEELQWDLDLLIKHWQAIKDAAESRKAPFLIHQESDVIMRSLRDYLRMDIGEIIIDNYDVYQKVLKHINLIRPDFIDKVKYYSEAIPLFHRYQIESQIESAFQRTVILPSGGCLVIDNTEALVTIDINSARSTKGGDIEETALNTNLEAADEIARQLRLRDLGGLVVIDFIDMSPIRNQREVENHLRQALRVDRARVQIGRISRFGLLEMSRQRLRPSLGEASQVTCPRCSGYGYIRGVESLSLSVLRLIRENCMKENTGLVKAQVPVAVATFLCNEKREHLVKIQNENNCQIIIIPNPNLDTPHYEIERVRQDDSSLRQQKSSYQFDLINNDQQLIHDSTINSGVTNNDGEPAVDITQITPAAPMPIATKKKHGLIKRLLAKIFGSSKQSKNTSSKYKKRSSQHRQNRPQQQRRHQSNNNHRHNKPQHQNAKRRNPRSHSNQNRDKQNSPRHHTNRHEKTSNPNNQFETQNDLNEDKIIPLNQNPTNQEINKHGNNDQTNNNKQYRRRGQRRQRRNQKSSYQQHHNNDDDSKSDAPALESVESSQD